MSGNILKIKNTMILAIWEEGGIRILGAPLSHVHAHNILQFLLHFLDIMISCKM